MKYRRSNFTKPRNPVQQKVDREKWKRLHSNPLQMLMDLNEVRQVDVSILLKVSPSLINSWQKGASMPNGRDMQAIVDAFGVEDREKFEQEWIDWKVGPDPTRSAHETMLNSHPIQHFIYWRGSSVDQIADATKGSGVYISAAKLRRWMSGKACPQSTMEITAIAQFMYENGADEEDLPRMEVPPDDFETLPVDLMAFLKKLQDWHRKFQHMKRGITTEEKEIDEILKDEDEKREGPQYNLFDIWMNDHASFWQSEDIASKFNVEVETVEDWRKGEAMPNLEQVRGLARITNIRIVDLLASFKKSK